MSVKFFLQRVGYGGFAGPGKPRKPDYLTFMVIESLAALSGNTKYLFMHVLSAA